MEIKYEFSPEEISRHMMVIGETFKLGSKPTEIGRGRRLFQSMIPEQDREIALRLADKCKYVYSHGLGNKISMTSDEIRVLRKLLRYVKMLNA